MKDFKISYDEDSDNLFIYLEGAKSFGAVEIGDFTIDFDKDENIVAIQIFNAAIILSKLIRRIVSLSMIKGIKAEIINFRNMYTINIEVDLNGRKERIPIVIPRIKKGSPVLY